MRTRHERDEFKFELYLAGERVPPGTYEEVDRLTIVRIDRDDYLPASLDGRVAAYRRIDADNRGDLYETSARKTVDRP